MGKVLIATVWKHEPIMKNTVQYDIEKLILVHEEEQLAKEEHWKQKEEAIKTIEDSLGDVIDLERVETGLNELYRVAEDVYEKIAEEERQIIVNITGGRKMQAIGTLLAASKTENVEEALYWSEEDSKGEDKKHVPRFNLIISDKEKQVLKSAEDMGKSTEIVKSLEMSQSMVYSHLKDLRRKGFLKKEDNLWTLTDLGRFMAD
jgi:CRISPR-associated protein Csa3